MRWYFQVTHHDLWDYDLPSPVALLDINVKGEKDSCQRSQCQSMRTCNILNHLTGKPVFGVEERPVPFSNVILGVNLRPAIDI